MSIARNDSILRYLPPYAWVAAGLGLLVLLGMLVYQAWPSRGPKRDLATPASRLAGHWLLYSGSEVPSAHLFFGPVSELQDKKGAVSMIDVDGGLTFKGTYKLDSQFQFGQDMTIHQDLGANVHRKVVLTVSHDGMHGRYRYRLLDSELDQRMTYVDAQAEPPPGFAEGLKAARAARD